MVTSHTLVTMHPAEGGARALQPSAGDTCPGEGKPTQAIDLALPAFPACLACVWIPLGSTRRRLHGAPPRPAPRPAARRSTERGCTEEEGGLE